MFIMPIKPACTSHLALPPALTVTGLVGQPLYPVLQKPLRLLVDTATVGPDHGGDLGERYPIGQEEKNPPPSGTRRTDGRRPLPRRQRLTFLRCEVDRECGFPSTRHPAPSMQGDTCCV